MRKRSHKDGHHETLSIDAPSSLSGYVPVVGCQALFPLEVWSALIGAFVDHPEHSSSNILRGEIIAELEITEVEPLTPDLLPLRRVRRRLFPSRPFDGIIDQLCTFYRGASDGATLIVPEQDNKPLPFYHPDCDGIALRYMGAQEVEDGTHGQLRVDFRPRRGQPFQLYPSDSRIFRTALAILTSLRKRGESSFLRSYTKRVHHDRLVAREAVQDARLELKPRYSWALREWREVTDPEKHVFEDIAIAAYLIALWRGMGFNGFGVDLRERKSWSQWRERSPTDRPTTLIETALDLPSLCLSNHQGLSIQPGAFLIGNHADELTPWVPLLTTVLDTSGSLNISCCAHDLTERFCRPTYPLPATAWPTPADHEAYETVTAERGGRYAAFVNRVAELTLKSGWVAEREMLRISSTRNAAIVARRRFGDRAEAQKRVRLMAEAARETGFKLRSAKADH